jgi:single-strand DNA-binding protein
MNQFVCQGRVVAEAELRTTSTGKKVGKFRLAVPEYRGETLFLDVEVWERQAEFAEAHLTKGKIVNVVGRLKEESWEKDGVKRSKTVVVAQNIEFALGTGGGDKKERQPEEGGGAPADIPAQGDDDIPF